MATTPTINAGPLKITLPTNLPKNEKDLICMILAGRLKDLLNGKFVCAQLAIDDLINDLTGVSPLTELKTALTELHSAIDDLKEASGADAMLGAINGALSQIQNVFSLGGLCPSPVQAPKIPDVLKQLNNNLFGQTNSILNALAKVSNPSMCLGAGPGGSLGVSWGSMSGDLANLKRVINNIKNNPAKFQSTIDAFVRNLKSQESRLKSELNRLKKNLADPFGINGAQQKARSIIAAKNSSDAYQIRTAQGVKVQNAMRMLMTPDLEAAIAGDSSPIIIQTVPILDYCGVVVGFERTSNVPGYEGWSTEPDAFNSPSPTALPVATYSGYDYFIEDSTGTVKVFNSDGIETTINIERGNHYRIGVSVSDANAIKFFTNSECTTAWVNGLTYNENSKYGQGIDIITPDNTTRYTSGYLDWLVSIQAPQTPNIVYCKYGNSPVVSQITVSGITTIPFKDRVFNISNALHNSMLHLKNTVATTPELNISLAQTSQIVTDVYIGVSKFGNTQASTPRMALSGSGVGYNIVDDNTVDSYGYTDKFNKVVRYVLNYPTGYVIVKKYINIESGVAVNQIGIHISSSVSDSDINESIIIKFDEPVNISNMTTLPYEETYAYNLIHLKNGNLISSLKNVDTMKFSLATDKAGDMFILWNMTSLTSADSDSLGINDYIFQTSIKIDYTDISGEFISSDPFDTTQIFYFRTAESMMEIKLMRAYASGDVDFGSYVMPLIGPYTGIGAADQTEFGPTYDAGAALLDIDFGTFYQIG